MWGAIAAAAAPAVIGGLASFLGAEKQNAAAMDRQNAANDFSAQQFATRYQTTVNDLQAAGLNPMLAYGANPSAPTSATPAPVVNSLGAAVEGANKSRATSAQALLQEEQINQSRSQTELNSAQAAKAAEEAQVAKNQAALLEQDKLKREQEIPKVKQETDTSKAMMETLMQQGATSAAQAKHYGSLIENLAQNNQNLKAELQRLTQANDQNAPESEIAKKYPTFYYIFHKLMPSLSGSIGKPVQFSR